MFACRFLRSLRFTEVSLEQFCYSKESYIFFLFNVEWFLFIALNNWSNKLFFGFASLRSSLVEFVLLHPESAAAGSQLHYISSLKKKVVQQWMPCHAMLRNCDTYTYSCSSQIWTLFWSQSVTHLWEILYVHCNFYLQYNTCLIVIMSVSHCLGLRWNLP